MLRRMVLVGIAALMLAGIGVEAMALQQKPSRTVLEGVYTDAQAEAGRDEFEANCARCHEGVCPDGPPLVGPLFIERWREDSLASLFNWVSARMPRNAQGTLSEKIYLDAIALLLKENGFPVGNAELTVSNVADIQFIGPNGPKPLPGNAVVEVVGCFVKNPSGAWQVTKGSAPVRYRYGNETTPEALKAAADQALGTATYELVNVEDVRPGFKPDSISGNKVHVIGPLLRERIFVTAIESLSGACTQ